MVPAARPSPVTSTAGIVVWRRSGDSDRSIAGVEILLVHPGGPFWARKDEHAWSIPKGEFDPATESPLDAACREFDEELGQPVPSGEPLTLEPFRAGKKLLHAFVIEGDFDVSTVRPDDTHRSMVELVWPPKSGRMLQFPEVDRAAWINLSVADSKLHKGQNPLVRQLSALATPD